VKIFWASPADSSTAKLAGFRSLLVNVPGQVEVEIDKLRALLGAVEADFIFHWKSKI
jgi:hypothetical protein